MVNFHNLFTPLDGRLNLVNNGGFTATTERFQPRVNTAAGRIPATTDLVDVSVYRQHSTGFVVPDNQFLGAWSFSGARCAATVNPSDVKGNAITSPDGGHMLKLSFIENGELVMEQVFDDLKRFEGVTLSIACSGMHIEGSPVVKLMVAINGDDINVTTVSAAALGNHRRFGDYIKLPDSLTGFSLKIKIVGNLGEELCLGGVCAVMGHSTKIPPYTSSLLDRVLPPGIVFMVEGTTCPPGFSPLPEPRMALVSGTKNIQHVEHTATTVLGFDTHDHSTERVDAIRKPVATLSETTAPLAPTQTKLVMGADFHRYPATVAFAPYTGELPVTVLGPNHTHKLQTQMPHIPPVFPITYCVKL